MPDFFRVRRAAQRIIRPGDVGQRRRGRHRNRRIEPRFGSGGFAHLRDVNVLRDPIWQFVGVVVALGIAAVSVVPWRRRKRHQDAQRQAEVAAALRAHQNELPAQPGYGKHKKRKDDGNLFANISLDFLNQLPQPLGVLAAHLDRTYTPENFGAQDWLSVFQRLIGEGFFRPIANQPRRLTLLTQLEPGPALEKWTRLAASLRRSIHGLNDE
jgi:hypothetical protein